MGVWGAGNFQSDSALDYLGADIVRPLIAKLEVVVANPRLAEPDEPVSAEVMVAVEVLCVLCEKCRAVPPTPELVEEGRSTYLRVWDAYIDQLSPKPGFKEERRRVIESSFAALAQHSREWHKEDT